MSDQKELSPAESKALRDLLHRLRDSAARRESLLPEESELVLSAAAELKSSGHSVAELLVKMTWAEGQLRRLLGISDADDRWPPIENLAPILAGSRRLCSWPGSDFIYAPTVLNCLGFLRQQNDPSVAPGNSVLNPLPNGPEYIFWSADAPDLLWRTRHFVGVNRETEAVLARREDLDRLAEALRFNRGRSGRRRERAVAFDVERDLYFFYLAFHGLLKKGQRETPRGLREERSIAEFLKKEGYPQFLIARLAQELSEHRQRRRGRDIRLALRDRAALLVAELGGKRGEYGLPECLGPDEFLDEDTSQPPSVAMRRPPPGPFATQEAEMRYQLLLKCALDWARGRVRQTKAKWNSGVVPPKPDKK